ncbi:hypothetical protein [Streptomyces qinglanensis]|uniref:hypothetical protein n=1 Tax=Streptomyces qinglanensis TaxID=943816 RepID=UPI0037BA6671
MEGPDTAHQFVNGDGVELLTTTDPYTRLSPGDQGTVRHFFEHPASADGEIPRLETVVLGLGQRFPFGAPPG